MSDHPMTALLLDWGRGDQSALGRSMPVVCAELLRVAQIQLRLEPPALGISPATVNRDWVTPNAWLYRRRQEPTLLAENGR